MRAVAEYVMRGRMQALWVAVLGACTLMFSWLSAAVIALVTLHRGPGEGVYILAWAVLPAGVLLAVYGDIGPLSTIVGTATLAVVLRWASSWQLVLLVAMLVGAGTGFAMLIFGASYLEGLAQIFAEFFASFDEKIPEAQLQAPGVVTLAGMIGLINAISCVLCLLLARWWQSVLYNPGGFRAEFHGLRLSPQFSLLLVLGMLAVSTFGLEYRPWAVLFAMPLSVAGLGFLHARAARRKLGAGWLSIFYVLWLVLDPVKLIVIGVAVADSLIDFRGRWPKTGQDTDLE